MTNICHTQAVTKPSLPAMILSLQHSLLQTLIDLKYIWSPEKAHGAAIFKALIVTELIGLCADKLF